jgi:alkanesulfonate monooxygenase
MSRSSGRPAHEKARLRFHWSMSAAGDPSRATKARAEVSGIPDVEAHVEFCRTAEGAGIEYLLTAFGAHRPDAVVLAAALGMMTKQVKFLVAVRSGLCSPTALVQQINTLSLLIGGRVALNFVNGHSESEQRYYGDFLEQSERYARSDELIGICRAFWAGRGPVTHSGPHFRIEGAVLNTPFRESGRSAPELYVGGASPQAVQLACKHDACLLTTPASDEQLAARLAPLRARDGRAGLIVGLIARQSREAALAAADALLKRTGASAKAVHRSFRAGSSSTAFATTFDRAMECEWLTPCLWTGAVPILGPSATALLGSYDEIADTLVDYGRQGIREFLFLGWPDLDEMQRFGTELAPRVREREMEMEPC